MSHIPTSCISEKSFKQASIWSNNVLAKVTHNPDTFCNANFTKTGRVCAKSKLFSLKMGMAKVSHYASE